MDHVTSRFADSLRGTRGRKRDEERERGEREREEGGRKRDEFPRATHIRAHTHTRTRGGTCVTYNRVRVYLGKSVCGHVPVRVG